MYEYGHEQGKLRKKKWNNKEFFIENNCVWTESLKKKGGGGNSVPRAPVVFGTKEVKD